MEGPRDQRLDCPRLSHAAQPEAGAGLRGPREAPVHEHEEIVGAERAGQRPERLSRERGAAHVGRVEHSADHAEAALMAFDAYAVSADLDDPLNKVLVTIGFPCSSWMVASSRASFSVMYANALSLKMLQFW